MHLYKRDNQDGLKVNQQWLPTNGNSKSPVVSCYVHETGCLSICQNTKKIGSNSSEGLDLLSRVRASRQRERSFLLLCPLYRLPEEGVINIKSGYSHLKRFGLKIYHPVSKIQIRRSNDLIKEKFPHRCAQSFEFQLVPDGVKLATKKSHHSLFVIISLQ